jgi:HAD superfamily hydrolase (TIGR01509 family)
MVSAAIFDVDGTLLDSLSMWEKIDELYLSRHGIKVSKEISQTLFTYSLEEGARYMKERFGIKDSVAKMQQDLIDLSMDFYEHHVPVKKGVVRVLEYLRERNIPMAIATSNSSEVVKDVLSAHHLDQYFKKAFTVDEVGIGKESPDIYLKACVYLQARPQNTLVFEDAYHAIKTVKKAGFITVGCYDAFSDQDQPLIKEEADYYVHEMDEILPSLKEAYVNE